MAKPAAPIADAEIDAWGATGGPLPKYPPGNVVANRFWTAYTQGEAMAAMAGPRGSLAARGFRAGLRRRQAEPGIDPRTDPRAARGKA